MASKKSVVRETTRWLRIHSSGTKFYEVTTILQDDTGLEIRRWGPVAKINGGGQSAALLHSSRASLMSSCAEQVRIKTKGKYAATNTAKTTIGFQVDLEDFVKGKCASNIAEFAGRVSFQTHYGTAKAFEIRNECLVAFGKAEDSSIYPEEDPVVFVPKAAATPPPPPPVRAADWGSW